MIEDKRMDKTEQYKQYITLLKRELVPAMGCTEPIAIAYIASYAKQLLEEEVQSIKLQVSGNILKNVKSVIVPNTDKLKGIKAAIAAGVVCGDASKKLEVLAKVSEEKKVEIHRFLEKDNISVCLADGNHIFDLFIEMRGANHFVKVRIVDYHTNIVYVQKDEEVILDCKSQSKQEECKESFKLSVDAIFDFVEHVDVALLKPMLDRQITYNMAIAKEGLLHDYGANIGQVLLKSYPDSVEVKAKAYAAAASDARMNGCELPVIIVSGSGNQGISASVPVIVYAQSKQYSDEMLYRALALSNLITLHQKAGIGRLSAFCGVVSAGVASGAAIAYLETRQLKSVSHTIVNALAIVSGMVCDGAKASCAAKIQSAIDAGFLGFHMYQNKQEFKGGDGLIEKGVENTIQNICTLAKQGMKQTDEEIIKMMLKGCYRKTISLIAHLLLHKNENLL